MLNKTLKFLVRKTKKERLKEVVEEHLKPKKERTVEEIQYFEKFKEKNPEEFKLMKSRTSAENMPKYLLDKIRTILSKYKRRDVYEKGVDYMHMYALIHSNEKPCDLNRSRIPFQNSTDFIS